MGSSPDTNEIIELVMKYCVFKLDSTFSASELIRMITGTSKFLVSDTLTGEQLARIIVKLERKSD